jgi:hypothetical protein
MMKKIPLEDIRNGELDIFAGTLTVRNPDGTIKHVYRNLRVNEEDVKRLIRNMPPRPGNV